MTYARVSEYGKRWNAKLPRRSISHYVGRQHCATPDHEIAALVRAAVNKAGPDVQAMSDQCVAYALACHAANRATYYAVLRGI